MSTATIEKAETKLETIVSGKDLRDLLLGAVIATGKDDSLPVLTGVCLEMKDGTLTATATDRYRLIAGRLLIEEKNRGENFTALIWNKDVKAITDKLKTANHSIILSVSDRMLTANFLGNVMTFRLLDGTFPPYEHLFGGEPAPVDHVTVNAKYLSAFDAIPRDKGTPTRYTFYGDGKMIGITLNCDPIQWRAALMPMQDKRA